MIKENWDKLPQEAKELALFADDHSELKNNAWSIQNNLRKKMVKNKYDIEKGKQAWKYHADSAARKYTQAYGGMNDKWHEMFPDAIRKKVASHFEEKNRESLKEDVNHMEDLIESTIDKKPLYVEEKFENLILSRITNLVNEKREEVKKTGFGLNKKDNAVHASLSGD